MCLFYVSCTFPSSIEQDTGAVTLLGRVKHDMKLDPNW